MNKKFLPVILIAVILLVGLGVFILLKKPSFSPGMNNNFPSNSGLIQGTLKDLFTSGKSQKCVFSSSIEGIKIEGTVYVADGKFRGDFKTISPEYSGSSSMISDRINTYMWMDNSSQGFKFPVDESDQTTATENNQPIDFNQQYQYQCENWNQDPSLFIPPANINFESISVPTNMPTGSSVNPQSEVSENQCAICDQVPAGESRDACLSSLNCE